MAGTGLSQTLASYHDRFPRNGHFELRKDERIGALPKAQRPPESPGVYLIYGSTDDKPKYIGKAGTLRRDGFSNQRLYTRIVKGKHGPQNISGRQFYQKQMTIESIDALVFRWFVTFEGNTRTIPAKAEAELIQAFYNDWGSLPAWNREY